MSDFIIGSFADSFVAGSIPEEPRRRETVLDRDGACTTQGTFKAD